MKRLFLLLFLLVSTGCMAETYYVSSITGNDADDGLTWANAFLTMGQAIGSVSAGDSIVSNTLTASGSHTAFSAVNINVNGSVGNRITWIDSLAETNGWDAAQPDTSNLWGTKVSVSSGDVVTIDGSHWHLIGIWAHAEDGATAAWDSNFGSDGWTVQQCKGTAANASRFLGDLSSFNNADSLLSCLFIGIGNAPFDGLRINAGDASDYVFINNTFTGRVDETIFRYQEANALGSLVWKNNIIDSRGTNSTKTAVLYSDFPDVGESLSDVNYNCYWDSTLTNTFSFNGSDFDLMATWEDSVNNYLAGGEANSIKSDPDLKNRYETAYITDSSPAHDAGTDVGYGDDIGYYQVPDAPAGGGQNNSQVIEVIIGLKQIKPWSEIQEPLWEKKAAQFYLLP